MKVSGAVFGVLIALFGTFLSSMGMILVFILYYQQKVAYIKRDKKFEEEKLKRLEYIKNNPKENVPPEIQPKIVFRFYQWFLGIGLMGISGLLDIGIY